MYREQHACLIRMNTISTLVVCQWAYIGDWASIFSITHIGKFCGQRSGDINMTVTIKNNPQITIVYIYIQEYIIKH